MCTTQELRKSACSNCNCIRPPWSWASCGHRQPLLRERALPGHQRFCVSSLWRPRKAQPMTRRRRLPRPPPRPASLFSAAWRAVKGGPRQATDGRSGPKWRPPPPPCSLDLLLSHPLPRPSVSLSLAFLQACTQRRTMCHLSGLTCCWGPTTTTIEESRRGSEHSDARGVLYMSTPFAGPTMPMSKSFQIGGGPTMSSSKSLTSGGNSQRTESPGTDCVSISLQSGGPKITPTRLVSGPGWPKITSQITRPGYRCKSNTSQKLGPNVRLQQITFLAKSGLGAENAFFTSKITPNIGFGVKNTSKTYLWG